jgi:hypothetical protein
VVWLPELGGDSNRPPGGSSHSPSGHMGVRSDTWSSLIKMHYSAYFLSTGFCRTSGVHAMNEPLVGGASCRCIQLDGVGEAAEEMQDGWGLRVVTAKRVILHIQVEEMIAVLVHPRVE